MGEENAEALKPKKSTAGSEPKPSTAGSEPPAETENTYVIRPNFQHKFRPVMVKEMIHFVLAENLAGKHYDPEQTTEWTKNICDTIKNKLQEMGYDRYKFIVQVVIAEQRGQGTKMVCRCFWDADSDNYAQDLYMNESLVAVAAAFGIFHY